MTTETAPRARARPACRPIDWHRAAERLAQGASVVSVAAEFGCSASTLYRRRRKDPVFQGWIASCRERLTAGNGERRLTDLRRTLHEAIENEVRAGNVRVILWLADRLKLVAPPDEHTPDHALRKVLGSLSSDELREFESLSDAS